MPNYLGKFLKAIIFNGIVDTGIGSSNIGLFTNYSNFTQVTLPNSLTLIDSGTFFCSSNLVTVYAPKSITQIGDSSFKSLAHGTIVYCETQATKNVLSKWASDVIFTVDASKF